MGKSRGRAFSCLRAWPPGTVTCRYHDQLRASKGRLDPMGTLGDGSRMLSAREVRELLDYPNDKLRPT
jgi:hypothetical protein